MRILILWASLVFIAGCASNNDKKNDSTPKTATSQPAKLDPIDPAVPDPQPENKKAIPLAKADIAETDIQFKINLPENYNLVRIPNEEGVRVVADQERFILDIYRTDLTSEGLKSYWLEGPEGYTFRRWIINGQEEILVEVEKNGKAEYHVDYLFDWEGGRYRLSSAKGVAFSHWEASQMFNVCRMLKVLNPTH